MKQILVLIILSLLLLTAVSAVTEQELITVLDEVKADYDLHDTEITIKYKDLRHHTMQSRPRIINLFRNEVVDEHVLIVNNVYNNDGALVLENYSYYEIKGMVAHELAHAKVYDDFTDWEMMSFGFKYFFSEQFRTIVEHETDEFVLGTKYADNLVASAVKQESGGARNDGVYYTSDELRKANRR